MTWRDVIDGSKARSLTLPKAAQLARQLEYKFLAWNGRIYMLPKEGPEEETDFTIADLEPKAADE